MNGNIDGITEKVNALLEALNDQDIRNIRDGFSNHVHYKYRGQNLTPKEDYLSRMSKKDYEIIAQGIRTEVDSHEDIDMYKASSVLRAAVSRMCVQLKADNPNFNSEKFKEAALGNLVK